ncbi:MAG: hypothetical protein AAGC93_26365 [Cyanobacteria bacterium P01_F01_bin.53]
MGSRLLFPEPLFGGLPPLSLAASLTKAHEFGTASPVAHRVPLLFNAPAKVLLRVDSVLGSEKGWCRAGSLAQVLYGLPGEPKKQVHRLYLDDAFFEFEGAGFSYYLEVWPYRWIEDYSLEVWAQQR